MTTPHPFDDIIVNTDTVRRDGLDRPLVFPPDYDKPLDYTQGATVRGRLGYTRTTTYVDALDDKSNLDRYHQRNVLRGIVTAPHILVDAAELLRLGDPDEQTTKRQLDALAGQARDAARESHKADMGTAVHHWCEQVDLAIAAGVLPSDALAALTDHDIDGHTFKIADHRADVAAYLRATLPVLRPVAVETLTIVDDLRIAGTPDRIVEWIGEPIDPPHGPLIIPGDVLVDDTKTGSIDYGIGKFAMQMAVYANGVYYDQETNTRRPLPDKLRRDWAIIVHVPAGQGTAQLVWLDIAAGWDAVVKLAKPVRAWRSVSRKLATPFDPPSIRTQIAGALTPDEVRAVWAANVDAWTDRETDAAKERVNALRPAA